MKPLETREFKAIPGQSYGTPKELWGFRSDRGKGTPRSIAWQFLEANREHLGIKSELDRLDLRRTIHGLGADHLIFQQVWRRRRIHRAYVTVHIGRDRRVYLVKSRAVPEDILRETHEPRLEAGRAVRLALAAVRSARGSARVVGRPELLWYPLRRLLHPAWRVRIYRTRPRSEIIAYVHASPAGSSPESTTWPRRWDARRSSCRIRWPERTAFSRSMTSEESCVRRRAPTSP